MTGKGNFDERVKWFRNAITKLPKDAANMLVFNTLTGLRPTESDFWPVEIIIIALHA